MQLVTSRSSITKKRIINERWQLIFVGWLYNKSPVGQYQIIVTIDHFLSQFIYILFVACLFQHDPV